MADALDLLRAALNAPGTGLTDDEIEAMEANLAVLEQFGEGTVEWGVRYEWRHCRTCRWYPILGEAPSNKFATGRAAELQGDNQCRNVEVVSRRRYVTDWQPVEPQP